MFVHDRHRKSRQRWFTVQGRRSEGLSSALFGGAATKITHCALLARAYL
jgi:hypothetical protein